MKVVVYRSPRRRIRTKITLFYNLLRISTTIKILFYIRNTLIIR